MIRLCVGASDPSLPSALYSASHWCSASLGHHLTSHRLDRVREQSISSFCGFAVADLLLAGRSQIGLGMPVSLALDSPQTTDAELTSAVQAPLLPQSALHAQLSSFRPPALKSLVIHETFTETAISSPRCVQPQVRCQAPHPVCSDPVMSPLAESGTASQPLTMAHNVATKYSVHEADTTQLESLECIPLR